MAKIKLNTDTITEARQLARNHPGDQSVWEGLGVSETTYYRWKSRGEREHMRMTELLEADPETIVEPADTERLYWEFWEATTRAREELLDGMETVVNRAALKDPAYALRVLAIRRPEHWARKHQHELTGKDGGPIDVAGQELAKQMAEELERLHREAGGD